MFGSVSSRFLSVMPSARFYLFDQGDRVAIAPHTIGT